VGGNHGNPKEGFPPFPPTLGNRKTGDFHIPTATAIWTFFKTNQSKAKAHLLDDGKVEIQNQDSHFPTVPARACGARKISSGFRLRHSIQTDTIKLAAHELQPQYTVTHVLGINCYLCPHTNTHRAVTARKRLPKYFNKLLVFPTNCHEVERNPEWL